ncbi:ketopantoate reductase family protein [Microbacterium sp.]|uniref:ketopantoate reductase family protein n=1 Tax=Microbacterium sp. TaxID=51671 RepID=UPI0039E6998D
MAEKTGRYLIVGAGAIGAFLAAQWTLAGVATVLVARGRALEAIARDGVRVRRPHGDEIVRVEVVGALADAQPTAADVVVLAVKSQDAESALTQIAWLPLADGTGLVADLPILTLQNGLATEDLALRRFRRVIGVSVAIEASHLEPGVVVATSYPLVGLVWLGAYPFSDPDAEAKHSAAFRAGGFATWVEPDIAAAKRRKLIGNLHNGVEVFDSEPDELEAALRAVRAEARALFDELGLPVAPPTADARLEIETVPGHSSGLSTWQSFARGASSEGDYLNGEVTWLARRHGRTAPLNEAVQRGLGALAARGGKPGEMSLADVLGGRVSVG